MPSCPHCGKSISQANPKFCPYCGKIWVAQQSAAAAPSSPVNAQGPVEQKAAPAPESHVMSPEPKENRYISIANEIRQTPPSFLASFAEIMNQLSQTNKLEVYLAAKKQIERTDLIYDYGFFSVAEIFLDSRIAPGDIVLYGAPFRLQSDDILLTCWPDKQYGLRILHMVASSFGADGAVEVKDFSGKVFRTSLPFILGKVVHIISFDSTEWRGILSRLTPVEFLTARLKTLRDSYQQSTIAGKEKMAQELDRRITALSGSTKSP